MARQVVTPNKDLWQARQRLQSNAYPDKCMSRSELATAVNLILHERDVTTDDITADYIAILEKGKTRWPRSPHRRWALRTALGVKTDAEIGLYPHRVSRKDRTSTTVKTRQTFMLSVARDYATSPDQEPSGRPPTGSVPKTVVTTSNICDVSESVAKSPLTVNALKLQFGPDHEESTSPTDDLDGFLSLTRLLASQRQSVAPNVLLSLVEAHRDCLAVLFRKAGSDPVRSDIGTVLGEASIVASRLWSAQGNRTMAIAHCAYARRLADMIESPILAATSKIFESNLRSESATLIGAEGDIMLGLRLLEEASAVAHLLSPAAVARMAAEQAQSYAVLKLRDECEKALDRARSAAQEITRLNRDGLFSDWSLGRLQVYEGTCRLLLGEPREAVDILTKVLDEMKSDHANTNVILAARVDLASAYAESGEIDQSCVILGDTYEQLARIGNHRGIDRARSASERLRPWKSLQSVRELGRRVPNLSVR